MCKAFAVNMPDGFLACVSSPLVASLGFGEEGESESYVVVPTSFACRSCGGLVHRWSLVPSDGTLVSIPCDSLTQERS